MRKIAVLCMLCSLYTMRGHAEVEAKVEAIAAAKVEDAREIMRQVYDRNDGQTQVSRQTLSTCRYAQKGENLVCAEQPRKKTFESVRKDYGSTEKDKKTISVVIDPPAEQGIGFLQYDYEDENKDADQWMYLSALGKVKRIVSGNENEPKNGSFFGSEFGYEDMELPHLDDFTYRLVQTETYQQRQCWVIETLPKPQRARKSNYSKSITWIDKATLLVLKSIATDRQGKKVKRITMRDIVQIEGVWMPLQININNLLTKRMSTIKFEKISINKTIEDEFLTLRTLTDGAFREQRLKEYRTTLN